MLLALCCYHPYGHDVLTLVVSIGINRVIDVNVTHVRCARKSFETRVWVRAAYIFINLMRHDKTSNNRTDFKLVRKLERVPNGGVKAFWVMFQSLPTSNGNMTSVSLNIVNELKLAAKKPPEVFHRLSCTFSGKHGGGPENLQEGRRLANLAYDVHSHKRKHTRTPMADHPLGITFLQSTSCHAGTRSVLFR